MQSKPESLPGLLVRSGAWKYLKNNGDIYCASASQMFGVPVEKHMNSHLRQKGKYQN